MLLTPFQHQVQVFQVILNQPVYYPIIHINLQEFLNKIFECNDKDPREYRRCILQPKENHCVLKTTPFANKCGFMVVFLCNSYLVITKKSVCKRVHLLTAYSFKNLIHEQCRKGIMHSSIVQLS